LIVADVCLLFECLFVRCFDLFSNDPFEINTYYANLYTLI
jgi:hypothetical protein